MNSVALQQAIYTRLAGFTALTSKVSGIYSDVPSPDDAADNSAFPYVMFNFPSIQPMDTKDSDGGNAVVHIHTFARGGSDLPRRAIEDAIYDALHKHDLAISGANTIAVRFETKTEMDDPDGVTKHSVQTFRITYDDI